jgi:hypothetical protein
MNMWLVLCTKELRCLHKTKVVKYPSGKIQSFVAEVVGSNHSPPFLCCIFLIDDMVVEVAGPVRWWWLQVGKIATN